MTATVASPQPPSSWWTRPDGSSRVLDDNSRASTAGTSTSSSSSSPPLSQTKSQPPVTLLPPDDGNGNVTVTTTAAPSHVVGMRHDLWANELLNFLLPTTWIGHWIKFLFVLTSLLLGCTISLLVEKVMVDDTTNYNNNNNNATEVNIGPENFLATKAAEFLTPDDDAAASSSPENSTTATTLISKAMSGVILNVVAVASVPPWWMYVMLMVLWTYGYYHQTLFASPLIFGAFDKDRHFISPCWMDPKLFEARREPMHVSSIRYFTSLKKARLAACCPDFACRRCDHSNSQKKRHQRQGRARRNDTNHISRLSRKDTQRISNKTKKDGNPRGDSGLSVDTSFDSSVDDDCADFDNNDDRGSYDTDDSSDDGSWIMGHHENDEQNEYVEAQEKNQHSIIDNPSSSTSNFVPLTKMKRQAVGLTPNVWLLDELKWSFQLMPTVEQGLKLVYEDFFLTNTSATPVLDHFVADDNVTKQERGDDNASRDTTQVPTFNANTSYAASSLNWKPIDIPGNWMLQKAGIDAGDIPIYTNQKYPFPCRPPVVPVLNPTGVYKLELPYWPSGWSTKVSDNFGGDDDDDEYYLMLHGAESACFVYWNGSMIGYFQDSRLPSEFLIPSSNLLLDRRSSSASSSADAVKPAAVIHIVVARWSDGSYLEDQDDWWMAGLHRSVELIRRPKHASIVDYHVRADLEKDVGKLKASVVVRLPKTVQHRHRFSKLRLRIFNDEQVSSDGDCQLNDEIWSQEQSIDFSKSDDESSNKVDSSVINFVDSLPSIKPWTAETPNLYTLTIEHLESSSSASDIVDEENLVQCESCRVGFRTISIDTTAGGILKVNNTSITVCGINRHEHDPDHGKVASLERMKQDIVTLKRNNFNAVRTSHYPTHGSFYKLCDYYGLYVCDEANIETHGLKPMGRLANDSGWEGAFVSRVTRMVERDWNHPCIILWSLGNEAGRGRNLMKARKHLLRLDNSRPVCYEGGGSWAEGIGQTELTDVVCPMYTSVPKLKALAKKIDDSRPIVLCEYSHSMNNSNGNLHLYWNAFWDKNLPRLQGGFIWDMIDQGLRKRTKSGREYYGYGGDFGDVINDRQFCINGMFSPEREPHPSVSEMKYLQQPVTIFLECTDTQLALEFSDDKNNPAELVDKCRNDSTKLFIQSRYSFVGLDHLVWKWSIKSSTSDQPLFGGFAVPENSCLQLLLTTLSAVNAGKLHNGAKYFLNIEGILKEPTLWAPSGHVVCCEQFPVHIPMGHSAQSDVRNEINSFGLLQTKDLADSVVILSGDRSFEVSISKHTGSISALKYNSQNVLGGHGLETSYTRATTDNDRGGMELVLEHMMVPWLQSLYFFAHGTKDFSHYMHWKHYGLTQEKPPKVVCTSTKVEKLYDTIVVLCDCNVITENGAVIISQKLSYSIHTDGTIRVCADVSPTHRLTRIPSLPRVGLSFDVDQDLERIQYFGRGPHENYPDRKSGAHFGVWNTKPSEMGYNYIVPSENGNRTDCDWISFRNKNDGAGLLVVSGEKDLFNCSALQHTSMELENATHTSDLDIREDGRHPIQVHIDHQLMGVGGDVSWFPCVYPPFLVKAESYKYSILFAPLKSHDDPAIKALWMKRRASTSHRE